MDNRWCCLSDLGWCISALFMEQELRAVKKECESLAQRLDNLESNRITSSVRTTDQNADRLQEQIRSLENAFHSLERTSNSLSPPLYQRQSMLEPRETVSLTACSVNIELPNQHRDA